MKRGEGHEKEKLLGKVIQNGKTVEEETVKRPLPLPVLHSHLPLPEAMLYTEKDAYKYIRVSCTLVIHAIRKMVSNSVKYLEYNDPTRPTTVCAIWVPYSKYFRDKQIPWHEYDMPLVSFQLSSDNKIKFLSVHNGFCANSTSSLMKVDIFSNAYTEAW